MLERVVATCGGGTYRLLGNDVLRGAGAEMSEHWFLRLGLEVDGLGRL